MGLVGHQSALPAIENRIMGLEPGGDVVGAQDRYLGGPGETLGTHEHDVTPRYGQDAGRSPGGRGHGTNSVGRAFLVVHQWVPGEEARSAEGASRRSSSSARGHPLLPPGINR